MAVKVQDLLTIEVLKNYKVFAGESGLSNIITGINIYEYILNKEHDRTGELYLTSFHNIRDEGRDALFGHIKILIDTNCPGLILCLGTYNSIRQETKELADRNNFPIVGISPNVVYADILEDAYKKIFQADEIENKSVLLYRLMSLEDEQAITRCANELNKGLHDKYCIAYFDLDNNDAENLSLLKACNKDRDLLIKYNDGYLLILNNVDEDFGTKNVTEYLDQYIQKGIYSVGLSYVYDTNANLKKAIKDSIYAHIKAKKISEVKAYHISEIGIYKILIPACENLEVVQAAKEIIDKVKKYDEIYNVGIYETISAYVKCNYDVNKTSEKLFLHKNTIRYRLKKLELIIDNSNFDCIEQVSNALRILWITD